MNRLDFYNVTTVEAVPELDYLYNNLTKFTLNYPVGYYVVKTDDLMRPDLISYKSYKSVKYWWLIMMVNGIHDIFEDLKVGLTLQIPNILDIYSFYKKYSVK
jgi:hypothetical protein